ncbi:multi-sensor hybrid histidine kinase [Flammeovirgaceae bacterium 311]|nr:multi-sensor hybrid histidine kinase [Flammeovirgaceae bacterium 311]
MLNKLSRNFLIQQLHDRRYLRFRADFTSLNLERIEKFSLIAAVATTLFALLPNILRCLVFTEHKSENIITLLFLETSVTCFMLLFYAATQWLKEENKPEKKILLVKSFIFISLLHALLISLAVYHHQSATPVFLLSCCALMSVLYWPSKRLLLFIGLGEFFFLLSHYTIYQEASLFHSSLLVHLIFLSIFYFISRTILDLKLRDFENAEKIESQTEQLQVKNQRLRMTEHALTTLHRNNHQGIFRIEGTKGFTYVNDHMAQMIGFTSASDMIREGKNISFIPQQELDSIARKLNQQGFAEGLEVEATRRDGSRFWMQFNCSVRTNEASGELLYEGSAMDITHRKKALQEALENAAKLEQAEKIAHAGFYEIDISSTRISYSSGYCAILEIADTESLTLNDHLEYIHPDDRQEVRRVLLQGIMRGEDYNLQYRVSNRNGEPKYLISKGKVIQNDRGRDFKILGTVQDVTQIHQQQEALEQSQAIIRTAFDHNNHFGIYIFDRDYKLLEFNKVSATIIKQWLGVELEKGADVRKSLRPATAETFIPIFRRALEGESVHLEYKILENTPHELWAEIYVGPVKNIQEEIIGAVMMAADITQRKRNESLLKNLSLVASHTDNAVMITDAKHRVEWVNEAFSRNTGYELEEIKGQYPKDFMVSELTDADTLKQLNNCLRTGRSFTDEILLCNRNNEQRWVLLTINPVTNTAGEVEKYVSILTDLSERKAFEQELRTAKETAEHSAEIKEYFLSTVSHELRTPLNAVIGLAYHLLQNNPRPDQEDDLSILKFSAENLLSLINDILDLSKIEAGKVHLEHIQFNLRDILNSLKHTFQTQTENRGLDFKLYLHDDVPHELEGDPVRLIQIITNLLSNAIKFTHQGMVKVEIRTKSAKNDQYLLQFEISDSGIGIPKDKLHTIFNKFEQASNTTNFTYGGTGLGLAITKQLVEIQGGTIWVKSTPGKGSCFGFSLPYRKSSKTDLQPLAYTYGVEVKKDLSRMYLLMAEDNQINQAVAGKFLQSWGICYDVAENGAEAVKMAGNRKYDLVLMDLQMPEMDGFEATRQIRLLPDVSYSQIPIIAITAAGIAGIEEKIKNAGMTDMVLKPFKPETLLYKLNHYCPFIKETPNSMHSPQNTPLSPDLDLSGVLEVAGGDKAFLQELVSLYIRQFTEVPIEIKAAVNTRDRVQLRRIFHKLRPSMLMLKIEKMTLLGESIHQQLHEDGSSFEELTPMLDQYICLVETIKLKLQQKAETENLLIGS